MAAQRLDLREVPPPQRHPKIFEAFEQLDSGDSLVLVNDHAPTPLYHQLRAEVQSFDAEVADLDADDVSVLVPPSTFGDLRIAFVTDPTGVRVELIEHL